MSTVMTGAIAHSLKKTLNKIVDDKLDGIESSVVYKKWCDTPSMEDAYEDDLEMAGPGLASEKPEGNTMSSGTIREGYVTRYLARTFALKLMITEEAIEDRKYPQVIDAARRLKRAMYKTMDIDATNMLVRMFNSSYTGGDGVCLGNSAHTLASGGTWSNILSTPLSPSRAAWIIATSQIRKYVGHDGVIEGFEPEKILCPTEQWGTWAGIVGSTHAPEAGSFNEINVVNEVHDRTDVIPIKYWTNTTTNWAIKTSAEGGPNFRVRRQPRGRSWNNNDQEIIIYGISARWARGWSDPRSILGSNA